MSQDVPRHVGIGIGMFCFVKGQLRIPWDVPRTCSDWDRHVLLCKGTVVDTLGCPRMSQDM